MKRHMFYVVLLLFSCSTKVAPIKVISTTEKQQNSKIKLLSGKILPVPQPKEYTSAILLLYYNDSTKIYAGSNFDGNFTFYNFKPKKNDKKSYIYAANKGCIPKKIMFDNLMIPILIKLKQDSINGLSYNEYIKLLNKNRPID